MLKFVKNGKTVMEMNDNGDITSLAEELKVTGLEETDKKKKKEAVTKKQAEKLEE